MFNHDDDLEDDSEYIGDIEYEITDESAHAEETDEIIDDNQHVEESVYESQLDMYDENNPPTLDDYVDDALYVSDTTADNDTLYYDIDTNAVSDDVFTEYDTHADTPKYDQDLIDDIFGISDDETEFEDATVSSDVFTPPDLPVIESPVLRRSGRNHQPGINDLLVACFITTLTCIK